MKKPKWYVWGQNGHYRRVGRFAIQSRSENEAKARGFRLYDDHGHRWELVNFPARIAESDDDLFGATLHPLN